MKDITFFHCADVHLDTPFTSLSGKPGLPGIRRRGLLDAFSRMIVSLRKQQPDLLFIAGDLFENDYSRADSISTVNALFATIPETKVIMISGNHDPEAANSFYNSYGWNNNVYFLGKKQSSIVFNDINTVIYGIGWSAGHGHSDSLNSIFPDPDKFNILLFHGDIDLQIGTRNYNALSSALLATKGFDYIAAGHNHKKRIYENIIFNPGSLDPLGFDEPGKHGYFVGMLSKSTGISVDFVENSGIEYSTLEFDITGIESDSSIIERLKAKTSNNSVLYKILLKGYKSLQYSPDTLIISDALNEFTMFSKIRDESTIRVPLEELTLLKGLKGEFARNVIDRLEQANDEDKPLLMKALYYGIEAIDKGNIEKAGGIEL